VAKDLRALLVEDSPDDAELLLLQLERSGFAATTERVAGAEAFREALGRAPWDVILSDYAIPQFSGTAALEILQSLELDIPFIIVSGSLGEEAAVKVMKAGAHDFFPKGNLVRLGSAIEREVREAELRRARIADRKRHEEDRERLVAELYEAVRARDTFLSIASHELRTPLTSLVLQIEHLQRDESAWRMSAEAFRARMALVARQVTRLTTLVESLVDIGHITSGRMVLSRGNVDLREVALAVVQDCDDLIRRSSSPLTLSLETVTGDWDRVRIGIVVTNLLSNAMKFGLGKPVSMTLSRDGPRARLTVTDHGIGIAREEQSRLFGKFERAVPETKYGGLGLGLWISRQIVEAHGGTIRVESRAGGGASFDVELPAH